MKAQNLSTSQKSQDFDKPHRQWGFGVKNLAFKKYSKISTSVKNGILIQCRPRNFAGAKPKISMRCKPNIFVLFKSPKILTSKSTRPWVLASKNTVLKYPKILTGAKPKISIRCKSNIFVLFKPQDFDKPHRQWAFGVKNLVFKKCSQDFDRC